MGPKAKNETAKRVQVIDTGGNNQDPKKVLERCAKKISSKDQK